MTLVARIRHILWSRWWRKALTIACLLVGLYAALGFLALPAILQWQLPKQVATHTTGHASVQEIRFNPFTFDLQLSGFTLSSSTHQPLVSFKKLDVNADPARLVTGALAFAWIRLYDPSINAAVDASGQLNFASLARPSPKPKSEKRKSGTLPDIVIDDLLVSNGDATYKDHSQSRDFRLALDSINFRLHDFSTQPDADGKYRFMATLGQGQSLAWHGTLGVAPLRSQGELSLQGLELAQFWPYISQRFKVSLQQGQLGASGQYLLRQSDGHLQLRVSNGKLDLAKLALVKKGGDKPLISVPRLDVDGIDFDLNKRRLTISQVATQDGRIRARLLKNGQVDLASLLKPLPASSAPTAAPRPTPGASTAATSTRSGTSEAPPATPVATAASSPEPAAAGSTRATAGPMQAPAPASTAPPPPFVVSVDTLAIHDYGIDFTDASKNKPVEFKLQPINVTIKGYSTDNKKPIALKADMGLNGGKLSATGTVALAPIKADLKFQLTGLPLSPFQPYVEPFARLRIEKGRLNVGGKLAYAAGPDKPRIDFDGNASVDDFDVTNTLSKQSLARLGKLAVNGIHYASAPAGLKVQSVILDKAFAQFIIEPDHSTNIGAVLASHKKAKPGSRKTSSAPAGPSKPMPVAVQKIEIRDSKLQFADHSMKPKVDVGIQALGGTIGNFSTRPGTIAQVNLKGEVGPYAPVSIKGTINPLGKSLSGDIGVSFKNLALTSFSPYSGKFAGYKIKKGKANLTLHYKIHDGLMQGKNDVVLDQLTLGEQVDSPDAIHLPLRLALALLRDSHGVIHLNLPVHGDLNNPQFAIGPLIWKVFVNVLTKAATAPFHLLAGLVSGSGDHLDHVDFAPGRAGLSSQSEKALSKLAGALKERPSLELDIAGVVVPRLDRYVLAQQRLLAQIRDTQPTPDASTMLSAEDQKRLLALYTSKFGTSPEAAVKRKAQETDAAYHQRVVTAGFKRLIENTRLPGAALEQLAKARADAIRDYLAKQAGLNPERIFILSPDLNATAQADTVRLPLKLKAN